MKTKFKRVADVEFSIAGRMPNVRISNVLFIWDAKHMASKDEQAVMACLNYARDIGIVQHMHPVFIATSPAKGE